MKLSVAIAIFVCAAVVGCCIYAIAAFGPW